MTFIRRTGCMWKSNAKLLYLKEPNISNQLIQTMCDKFISGKRKENKEILQGNGIYQHAPS